MPTTALVRAISDILSGSKVIQMERMLPVLEQDLSKVATRIMSSRIGRKSVRATTFYHREDQIVPWEFQGTASGESGASITFTNDYVYIMEGDLLRNETDDAHEVVLVDGYATRDTTVDVVRGVGSTVATATGALDKWIRIGTAHEEGSSAPDALMTKEVQHTSYIPFQRKAIELTTQAKKTEVYHGDDRLHQAGKKMIEFKLDLEAMIFWSVASADASGGAGTYPQLSSVGLFDRISTNTGVSSTLTFAELRDFFDAMRKYHSSGKFACVCGSDIMNIISDFAYDAIRTTTDAKTFGVNIKTLILGPSEVSLIEEPLWTGSLTGTTLFGLPEPMPKFLKLATFADEGLKWKINVDTNDDKYIWKDSLTSQIGLEVWEEKKMGYLEGIISG